MAGNGAATVSKLSKFRGALTAAVMGDCLGAPFEAMWIIKLESVINFFKKPKDKEKIYQFTDDTAMARSVAKSLICSKGFTGEDMAKRFVEEYYNEPNRGYGGNVIEVFWKLRNSNYGDIYEPAGQQFDGQGSYGNGGAMRIAPAALFGYKYSREQLNDIVGNISRITHTHIDAINGAKLQTAAVHLALHQKETLDPSCFLRSLTEWMTPLEKAEQPDGSKDPSSPPQKRRAKRESEEGPQPFCYKLSKMEDMLIKDASRSEVEEVLGNDISALGSVPAAIYCFLRCLKPLQDIQCDNPVIRTIAYAVSLGGDTDTIATMAGAIAGAYYGMEAVPKDWQQVCEGVDDAIDYADKLLKFSEDV